MDKWTAMWGTATSVAERREGNYAKDITLRYSLKSALDGTKIRVRFSNICGKEPVKITRAYAADYLGEAVSNNSVRITFNGSDCGIIPPGSELCSDAISFVCRRGSDISISMYFEEMTEFMSCVYTEGPCSEMFFANGDFADAKELPRDYRMPSNAVYFLNTVDVLTDASARTIILFGDSITAQSWPERFSLKLLENKKNIAAIKRGVSGTRVLGQYDCLQYAHYGLSGKNRFVRECSAEGADSVLVFHGINDIIHPDGINPYRPMSNLPSLADMVKGFLYYINEAHKMGLKIYFATLLPIEGWRTYEPWRNDLREEINNWIRTTDLIDGYVDFDTALSDPNNPARLKPEFNSGDWLHPSDDGAQMLADTFYEMAEKEIF